MRPPVNDGIEEHDPTGRIEELDFLESCPQDNEPERRLVFGVGYGSHFKPACHSGHVQSVDWIQFVYDEVEARSK